ncbi:hypothetical protein CcaverHIS002_0408590 [Cutaneotrichosporon cavernicola]|nr:hypothetical protein CcaverHIS002_0408590 [Cutaneotrichosporon cavernicola]
MTILVHPTSLSLLNPPTHLSLPSRFPPSPPRSAASQNGNTFIWAGPTVWEYDGRGRRVGELTLPSAPTQIAPFSRGVAAALAGEVRIFRRAGNGAARWALAHTLQVGGVTAMSAGEGVLVVCAMEVMAFATESGVRLDLPDVEVEMPVRTLTVVDTPMPSFLIPTPTGLAKVDLTGSVSALPLPLPGITDVAVCGETIAAVGGEMLALDSDIIELGKEAAGVAFLNPSTVSVWTTEGDLLLVDVESRDVATTEHKRVLAIHPCSIVKARSRAASQRVLAERTNVPKKVGFDKRTTISTVAPTPLSAKERTHSRGGSLNFVKEEDDSSTPSPTSEEWQGGPGWDVVEELRREIGNLQMDMLRMGRGLKNEIRVAIAPLVDELRASRETIAAQQAEIERLRRGY